MFAFLPAIPAAIKLVGLGVAALAVAKTQTGCLDHREGSEESPSPDEVIPFFTPPVCNPQEWELNIPFAGAEIDGGGDGIAVSEEGFVYVVGHNGSPEGSKGWVQKITPEGQLSNQASLDNCWNTSIATDSHGDVYTASGCGSRLAEILKSDAHLNPLVSFNPFIENEEEGGTEFAHVNSVTLSSNGNIVVGGQLRNRFRESSDGFVNLLTPEFEVLATGAYFSTPPGAEGSGEVFGALQTAQGDIVAVGAGTDVTSPNPTPGSGLHHPYVIRIAKDGEDSSWAHQIGSHEFNEAYDVVQGFNGDFYATGYVSAERNPVQSDPYFWVARFDQQTGGIVWEVRDSSGDPSSGDQPHNNFERWTNSGHGLVVDSQENLHVIGAQVLLNEERGRTALIRLASFTPQGDRLTEKHFGNPVTGKENIGWDIAIDACDNLYLTGEVYVAGEGQNLWVKKIAPQ